MGILCTFLAAGFISLVVRTSGLVGAAKGSENKSRFGMVYGVQDLTANTNRNQYE